MPKAVIAAGVLLVLALALVVFYAAMMNRAAESDLMRSEKLPAGDRARRAGSGAVNHVVVGSDKNGPESGAGRSV